MSDVAVIVPVLGRPDRAAPLAANVFETAPGVPLVFVCSPGDFEQIAACRECASHHAHATDEAVDVLIAKFDPGPGDFAKKMNLAYELTAEPWLFQAADDVRFKPGWLEALMLCAAATGAQVIGTDDCANPTVKAGRHSTHTLISRAYCDDPGASMDGPGTVFSTAYGHQYCDTELVELAKWRGVWAFSPAARVVHEHPLWNGGGLLADETYRRGQSTSRADARLYAQRSRLWRRRRALAMTTEGGTG